jgi:hypothetical protein
LVRFPDLKKAGAEKAPKREEFVMNLQVWKGGSKATYEVKVWSV